MMDDDDDDDNDYVRALEDNVLVKMVKKSFKSHVEYDDVVRALEVNTSVTMMRLNGVENETIQMLLKKKNKIVELDLQLSCMGVSDVIGLCNVMSSSSSSLSDLVKLNLYSCNLKDSSLCVVCECVASHPSLRELWLGKNNIRSSGAKYISQMLQKNNILRVLSVRHGHMRGGDVGMVCDAMNQSMTYLDLYGNSIEMEGSKALSRMLLQQQNNSMLMLQGIDIGYCDVPDDGMVMICNAICNKDGMMEQFNAEHSGGQWNKKAVNALFSMANHVKTLQINGCSVGIEGMKQLHNVHCVTHLDLTSCRIGREGAPIMVQALKQNTSLKKLFLKSNKLGHDGAKAIAELIRTNRTLTVLDLVGNDFNPQSGICIADALRENNTLCHLELDSNNIQAEGCSAIMDALKQNKTLTLLEMSMNNFGPEGARAIGETLKVNQTLIQLRIDSNNIAAEGVEYISNGLKVNKSLKNLFLFDNYIGTDGFILLCQALLHNTTLTALDVGVNGIDNDAPCEPAFSELIKTNQHLKELIVSGNDLEWSAALCDAFKLNGAMEGGFGVPTQVTELCERNFIMHERARRCVEMLQTIRRFRQSSLSVMPKEIVKMIGEFVWITKIDIKIWKK